MDDIRELMQIDYVSFCITMLIMIFAFVAILEIIEKFVGYVGKPVTWISKRKKDHEDIKALIIRMDELEQHRLEDIERSNENDRKIEEKLDKISSMVIDSQIDSLRSEILNFCSSLSNGNHYNMESFDHVMSVYKKYERILDENGMENGLVEESMRYIREMYQRQLNNAS